MKKKLRANVTFEWKGVEGLKLGLKGDTGGYTRESEETLMKDEWFKNIFLLLVYYLKVIVKFMWSA